MTRACEENSGIEMLSHLNRGMLSSTERKCRSAYLRLANIDEVDEDEGRGSVELLGLLVLGGAGLDGDHGHHLQQIGH